MDAICSNVDAPREPLSQEKTNTIRYHLDVESKIRQKRAFMKQKASQRADLGLPRGGWAVSGRRAQEVRAGLLGSGSSIPHPGADRSGREREIIKATRVQWN